MCLHQACKLDLGNIMVLRPHMGEFLPFRMDVGDTVRPDMEKNHLSLLSFLLMFLYSFLSPCLFEANASQKHLAQGGGGGGGSRDCLDKLPPHSRPGLRQPLPASVPHLRRRATRRLNDSAPVPYVNAMQQVAAAAGAKLKIAYESHRSCGGTSEQLGGSA